MSILLEELEMPYSVTIVDITKGEQFDPAFLRISPNNRMPAIVCPPTREVVPMPILGMPGFTNGGSLPPRTFRDIRCRHR